MALAAGTPLAQAGVRFGTLGAVESTADVLDGQSPSSVAPDPGVCTDLQRSELEQSMSVVLDSAALTDFTLLLESIDGRTYTHAKGVSSGSTLYESASTSKWVAAAVILDLVDRGVGGLTLDSKPQDFISWWTPVSTNPASNITLRHLLSFTSGFNNPPPTVLLSFNCTDLPNNDFESCVQEIYNANVNNNIEPGTQYYYNSNHLQIAGLMAIKARGGTGWEQLFDEFKTRTGLFGSSAFSKPSLTNPRLAGGMEWTGTDYMGFLEAIFRGMFLSSGVRAEMLGDQRGVATVAYSPVLAAPEVNEDWHYGLGNWVEGTGTAPFEPAGRNSSPGAFGAYPFIDFSKGYFGLLARKDSPGSFPEGVNLFRSVESTAARWATRNCR